MKKLAIFASIISFALFFSAFNADKTTVYTADASATQLKWTGKKVTGEHFGMISLKSGEFSFDKDKLTGGSFVIDMSSMTCDDLEDAGYNAKLIGHLQSDDFFSTEKFPEASFKIKEAKMNKENTYDVVGDLTVKGITQEIAFPATVEFKGDDAVVKATITVNRTKYDIKYGSGSFFEGLGDKMIYDDFTIDLNLVAKK